MCTCVGNEFTNADFIEQGAGCIGTNCPEPTINTVGVDYDTPGLYDYTVTCGSGCEPAEGTVCVEDLVCAVHTGTYGTADLINDYGEVMGTATVSIGGFNRLNVNLAPKNGWTILDSRLYAGGEPVGGCDPDLFSYQSTDDMTYTVVMGSIDGWHCGEPLHVNVYAEMQKGEDVIEECTGDIVVDGYYTEVCDLDPCWDCGTCGGA
jgi:hypothetical protein